MRMCNFKSQGKEITLVNNLVFSFPLVYLMMALEDFCSANLVLLSIKTNCFQSNKKKKKKKIAYAFTQSTQNNWTQINIYIKNNNT